MLREEEATNSTSNPSVDQRASNTDGARPNNSWISAPIIGALCCLGLILFLIASVIVLSLIPVYIERDTVGQAQKQVILVQLADGSNLRTGPLNAAQRQTVQNELQAKLDSDPRTQGAKVRVVDATALATARRKRQVIATFIQTTVIITGPSPAVISIAIVSLNRIVLSAATTDELENEGTTVATTTTTTQAPTTNATRTLSRRSIREGGAPAGIVYIDIHQIAETKGSVSTVSFYADQTCAFANIEIGAFNLINRQLDINNAEFILAQKSKTIKLGDASQFKPYMSLITIQLCNENSDLAADGSLCKGSKFEVLPYQYIGIRSDTCRFGYAATPSDPVLAVTLKPIEISDPFAEPYKNIKYKPSEYTILQSITIEPTKSDKVAIKAEHTEKDAPRVLFIGSYTPRRCGLAKFLEDLTNNYKGSYDIVAVDEDGIDPTSRIYSDKVVYRLNQTDRDAYLTMATFADTGAYDIINVQHEYGLFGGMMGEYIIQFLSSTKKPVVTTFHTVIPNPSTYVIGITRAVCALSTRVIVMAELGRHILVDIYGIDESKIVLLPHGVPDLPFDRSITDLKSKLNLDSNAPTMTTFGLIHRNKNIELALEAMKSVVKSVPNMMYLVIGETHPAIMKYEGESYRNELESNVTELGLTNNVRFINKFVGDDELLDYLGASDIYLTPYAREDQYVSGTLSWAVGLGKAVISTPYLYAKELLNDGRGFLVPFNDAEALSSKIVDVVQDHQVRNVARRQAYKFGRQMAWPHVGEDLVHLFREVLLFS